MTNSATPEEVESYLDEICAKISEGNSLRSICRDLGLGEGRVRYWFNRDVEARDRLAAARELGCDALADECFAIADTTLMGQTVTRKPVVVNGVPTGGFIEEVKTEDMLGHRRMQIDTRLRLIGKWSQRYGDKVQHHVEVDLTDELREWLGQS